MTTDPVDEAARRRVVALAIGRELSRQLSAGPPPYHFDVEVMADAALDALEAAPGLREAAEKVLAASERSRQLDTLNAVTPNAYEAAREWRTAERELRAALDATTDLTTQTNKGE